MTKDNKTPTPDLCREAFEEWYAPYEKSVLRKNENSNSYTYVSTAMSWLAWQAAWNTRLTEAQVKPTVSDEKLARKFSCACISSSSEGCEKQFGHKCGCCEKTYKLSQAFAQVRADATQGDILKGNNDA